MTLYFIAFLPVIVIPFLISLVDFINIIRNRRIKHYSLNRNRRSSDFTILLPIFGDIRYLKNIQYLKQYGPQVLLCTTDKETDHFYHDLEMVAREAHFQTYKSSIPITTMKQRASPWMIYSRTLNNKMQSRHASDAVRDEIIKEGIQLVKTKYCIFIDGDTIAKEPLEMLVGTFEEHKYDIASVRVLASKEDTIMEKLQSFEYKLAMDARKLYPWLTSGAASVAKFEIIKDIMAHHSLFFSGGDIEIGKLAGMLKYKVGHIPFDFYTDVPQTFNAWVKQRLAWSGGGFRHAIINFNRYSWRHPLYYFYFTGLVYAFTPLRWYELITHPLLLPLIIGIYWVLIYLFHWKERRLYLLLFPLYAFIQVMVIIPLGLLRYFHMAYHSNNVGLIRLRYQPNLNTV